MLDVRAHITDGRLPPATYASWRRAIQTLNGEIAHIRVERAVAPRSLKQNRFLWGPACKLIMRMHADQGDMIGKEEASIFIKDHVLKLPRETKKDAFGYERVVRQSSKNWTRDEMRDYLTAVEAWAAGWGYGIPEHHHQPMEGTEL